MVEKLHEYQGPIGVFHTWRDVLKEKWDNWKENRPRSLLQLLQSLGLAKNPNDSPKNESTPVVDMQNYSHIFRNKTRRELIRISAAVMGLEFCYAAETAFVSPTLLKIGVDHQHMTLVWAVSPCIGFFVTPILGSLSDRCTLPIGRRRPFIILLACGIFLGMVLVPNGESLGHWVEGDSSQDNSKFWPVFFTILGTVLSDFNADACQSPTRAYLLDICVPEDHAKGLSTFTVMAGLGGCIGYFLGGVDWDSWKFGEMMGGHVKTVFTLVTILFLVCVTYTITSFKEMPLKLQKYNKFRVVINNSDINEDKNNDFKTTDISLKSYGTLNEITDDIEHNEPLLIPEHATFGHYLKSIIVMPNSIKLVCLTNLFCWMAHVCYSLYFTDYVGEAVFGGDPMALPGTAKKLLYEEGVRFGSMGMSMYSLSCACYSSIIEKLIKQFGAKRVYVGGLLFYSGGMFMMAITGHKFSVILFSWAAGVMYSTMFTMPFLLIAYYHSTNKFSSEEIYEGDKAAEHIRGLGTDVAVVSSSVFVAQFILSMVMGTIIRLFGSTSAVVYTASFLGFCASIVASQIMYLDL